MFKSSLCHVVCYCISMCAYVVKVKNGLENSLLIVYSGRHTSVHGLPP
ncbi:hypothetical protein F383_30921 [Gossypium arboreum]|uniref:Uncharacterized protein n=1 Tax=Gossypium arboreum TaxID=29729 RepID=A0A0B0MXY7_GOSAR|nr:hypothetical protein F383_30921 [Gossypium arboreum]